MTTLRFASAVLSFVTIATLSACDSDSPTAIVPPVDAPSRAVIGSGDVGTGFLMRAQSLGDEGMDFLLRGDNLRRQGDALLVDVVATNEGSAAVALPAALTLVTLDPAAVTVRGADNAATAAGASFDLVFASDDEQWSVGEQSAPRTLEFVVAEGQSIGFVSRIDVAMPSVGGSIGGTVYEDRDRDGVFDGGEAGVRGFEVALSGNGIVTERTRTSRDGTYRFDGLGAGAYTVTLRPQGSASTTGATQVQVLLVEDASGGVTDFLGADFGVTTGSGGSGVFEVREGDHVEVKGRFDASTGRLRAREIERDDDLFEFELEGPVTAVDATSGILEVMGVALDVARSGNDDWLDDCTIDSVFDFAVGDFVDIDGDYPRGDRTGLFVDDIECDDDDDHKVEGRVEAVEFASDGRLSSMTILGIRIEVDGRTRFGDDDDGDDDGDDDRGDDRS